MSVRPSVLLPSPHDLLLFRGAAVHFHITQSVHVTSILLLGFAGGSHYDPVVDHIFTSFHPLSNRGSALHCAFWRSFFRGVRWTTKDLVERLK